MFSTLLKFGPSFHITAQKFYLYISNFYTILGLLLPAKKHKKRKKNLKSKTTKKNEYISLNSKKRIGEYPKS